MSKEACKLCGFLGCHLPQNAEALGRNFSGEEAARLLEGHQEARRPYDCANVDTPFEELLVKFEKQTEK